VQYTLPPKIFTHALKVSQKAPDSQDPAQKNRYYGNMPESCRLLSLPDI
jgi:hypothetical protein